ncbi:MAG: Gfo/Idh/MocA family protein [Chloroflexota bacterium]
MSNVRWGLLSTANINRRVIPAIRSSQRGELVAVASRTKERAQAYATEWEIEQAFGSYEAMLESGAVDAVYIGLPNSLHAEWTIRALENGVHVLCEKPFALTLEEVDSVVEAVKATGNVVTEAFMYRHHPQTKLLGRWVQEGRLGDLLAVRGVFNFQVSDARDVRLQPELGGGCLWDVGVYPLSLAQYIFGGRPQEVMGHQIVGDSGVDEVFMGQMSYGHRRDDGPFAQIMSSFRSPFYTYAAIIGTQGRLTFTRPFVAPEEGRIMYYPADGEPQKVDGPQQYLYLGEVEDMHAAILDGAEPYLSLAETRDHVRTVLALYESAEKGQAVAV